MQTETEASAPMSCIFFAYNPERDGRGSQKGLHWASATLAFFQQCKSEYLGGRIHLCAELCCEFEFVTKLPTAGNLLVAFRFP